MGRHRTAGTREAARQAAELAAAKRALAAEMLWHADDEATRHRTAMLIAAHLLECVCISDRENVLIDWLRSARPEFYRQVATGVAVHALHSNVAEVWDALMALDTADVAQADEWYLSGRDFVWAPQPEWLATAEEQPNG